MKQSQVYGFLLLFLSSTANETASVDESSVGDEERKPTQTSNSFETGSDLRVQKNPWVQKSQRITCCRGGDPKVDQPQFVRNFSFHVLDYVIDERQDDVTLNCRVFSVKYWIPPETSFLDLAYSVDVVCDCPDVGGGHLLDRNCRKLPGCKNNGVRSLADPRRCVCPQPFFGDNCERFCDQGQRLKGPDGRDYCSCVPFYQGLECREMVCLNGGREENGRCICPPQYLGYHCEIDTNRTGGGVGGSRFQRFGDQSSEMFTRDISGTIFSLIMIVVLVVSMYLLMKYRMQVQTRYLNRRPDLLGACSIPISSSAAIVGGNGATGCLVASRRGDMISPEDPRIYAFRPIGPADLDGGPPPYIPPGQRRRRNDVLPPLPSYEDATKLPPLRHHTEDADEDGATPLDSRRVEETANPLGLGHAGSSNSSPTSEHVRATVQGTGIIRSTCSAESVAASATGATVASSEADEDPEGGSKLDRESAARRSI
jgi:hypothetical protein